MAALFLSKETNFEENRVIKAVNKKMQELMAEGWLLKVTKDSDNECNEGNAYRYYEFVQYNRNGYIDDIMAIRIIRKTTDKWNSYKYYLQIIDDTGFINEDYEI